MRTEREIRALLDRTLAMASAPEAQVSYNGWKDLSVRFADNAITQNCGNRSEALSVRVAWDRRCGAATSNRLDPDSIRRLVARAEDIARISPEDPEHVPPVPPQTYPATPPRWFEDAARLTPDDLAAGVARAVGLARPLGYSASGFHTAGESALALANSRGLFAATRTSWSSFSATVHGPRGSGSFAAVSESAARVDPAAVAERALATARAAQDPSDIEPGDYAVILEPLAVRDLLGFLLWDMDARRSEEGATCFAGKVGEKLFADRITISTEIDDPELPAPPFGVDGLASRRAVWVRNGVLERLRFDRYWAQVKGETPDPISHPLFMAGEDRSVDDLVAMCDRGLLVKRFWYIRYVDHRQHLLTGMTRDGLFLVERGRITRPVVNLRFNESPLAVLRNAVALSRPERVETAKLPAILSTGFTFSSKTESV